MGKICLDFPLLGTGNEVGTNNAAYALFKSNEVMNSLAREVTQNSLDAKNKALGINVPVRLKFELVKISKKSFPLFQEYERVIDNSYEYWKKSGLRTADIMTMLEKIKEYLTNDEIPMLVMSDYNTNGLEGVNAKEGEVSYWHLLADSEGISIKPEETSLGSYGIGKNAPFAYSKLNMVLYNTLAKDGGRAFQGVTHLVTSQRDFKGKMARTMPTGKYLYLEDEVTGRPILPKDNCGLANIDVFKRSDNEFGTDVAIVGFDVATYANWEQELAVALIKNFTLAIMNGKLEVEVKNGKSSIVISKATLEDILFKEYKSEPHLDFTRTIVETVQSPDKAVQEHICDDGDLTIYIKYKEDYERLRAHFRSTGMLINMTEESFPGYSIVIVVNDVKNSKLSKTLAKAEPPQHNVWAGKYVHNDVNLRNTVNRYLRIIKSKVKDLLDSIRVQSVNSILDAGAGEYLAGAECGVVNSSVNDDLKVNLKITEIITNSGKTIFNQDVTWVEENSASRAKGKKTKTSGESTRDKGKRKRDYDKSKHKRKIDVVTTDENGVPGITKGDGYNRMIDMHIVDCRIHYLGADRYKLYVNSPQDYENVYIECFAGRDSSNSYDTVKIKTIKTKVGPLLTVNSKQAGPVSLKNGDNDIFIEFENHEYMSILPQFKRVITVRKTKED